MGGLRRVDHPNDLQLDARWQHLEQPMACTEQHWDQMDLQLVQHTGLECPLRRVRALDHHAPLSRWCLRLRHRALDLVAPAQSDRLRPDGRSVDLVGQVRGKWAVGRLARDQPQVRAYAGEQGATPPRMMGARCRRISSISPALRYWRSMSAPPLTITSCAPAAARAWAMAASIPSVTKM